MKMLFPWTTDAALTDRASTALRSVQLFIGAVCVSIGIYERQFSSCLTELRALRDRERIFCQISSNAEHGCRQTAQAGSANYPCHTSQVGEKGTPGYELYGHT